MSGNAPDRIKSKQETVKRLQNAFAMTVLMGLTWVFGFFAIEDAQFVFSLIFCLCNSFQGLVLFLLFCARQEDVKKTIRPYIQRLCCSFPTLASRSQTTSTGVRSSTSQSKSPYSDMDFSASGSSSKSPYSDMDFSTSTPPSKSPYSEMDFGAAVPMSPLSADNPMYDNTVDAVEQETSPVAIKEKELPLDEKLAEEGQITAGVSSLSSADNLAYDSAEDDMVQIAAPEVLVEINEAELLEDTEKTSVASDCDANVQAPDEGSETQGVTQQEVSGEELPGENDKLL